MYAIKESLLYACILIQVIPANLIPIYLFYNCSLFKF